MMHSMSSKSRSTHSKKSPARSTLKNRVHAEHVPTFHGLHGWMSHVFEHLGWMVLAKKYGYTDKLVSYKSSVDRLADALEKRLEMIQEPDLAKPGCGFEAADRKMDLVSLHKDVMVLKAFIAKNL